MFFYLTGGDDSEAQRWSPMGFRGASGETDRLRSVFLLDEDGVTGEFGVILGLRGY